MGNKRFDTTFDLVRHGANLRVQCRCGRDVVIDGHQLDQMRRDRRWPVMLGEVARRLRCRVCGDRPARALPTPRDATIRIGPTMIEKALRAKGLL